MLELLVALAVTSAVTAATLAIALSSRGVLETDEQRTTINQNLRSGMDLVGVDVRQAGERLPGDMPAIEINDGGGGAPDTLILRRNLLDYSLPLCKDISGGTSADSIFVAKKKVTGKIPPGCAPVGDDDSDGWPDNMQMWRNYRLNGGGLVQVFIYDPITENGEFFLYDAEDNSTFHLHKFNADHWKSDYKVANGSRLYMLEQLEFRLSGEVLQSVVNMDNSNALNLVNHITDFQARAFMSDGSVKTDFGPSDEWTDLRCVEVTMTGGTDFRNRSMDRTLTARFFPRNILSN
jgi:type IV pilus assembly protein PilW